MLEQINPSPSVQFRQDQHNFARVLSLDLLVDFWRQEVTTNAHGLATLGRDLVRQVEAVPELRGAIPDRNLLWRHQELLTALMAAVFPPAMKALAFAGAAVPATFDFFHGTPRFERELLDENHSLLGRLALDDLEWPFLRALFGYLAILRRCYGIDFPFEKSVIVELSDPKSGLDRYFQMRGQFDMAQVRPIGELPVLPDDIECILARDLTNLELFRQYLPPEKFEFYGFMVHEATDVTEEIVLSRLKQELIERDPLISSERFAKLQQRLRTLLGLPGLKAAVIGLEGDSGFQVNSERGYQLDDHSTAVSEWLSGPCVEHLRRGQPMVLEDLRNAHLCSPVMREYQLRGEGSLLMCPLLHEGRLVGLLLLVAGQPHALNALTVLRLGSVLPLFTLALLRTSESFRHRVQAAMKEQFTAIHPAVEWRFREAASRYVRTGDVVDINFNEVFSLFASSDIRSSSTIRNQAIQQDLLSQVALARDVVRAAYEVRPLAYLESQEYRLSGWLSHLEPGLTSGDEARAIEFLRHEIEPLFVSLETFGESVARQVALYRQALDPHLGFLYAQRKAYEDSVNILTDTIADILTEEQAEAQAIFPHYFQMYKTDGVDHTIYVGDSLTERTDFDPLYLRNLRLWQLMATCRVVRVTHRLEGELPMPLTTAHLILAQRASISLFYSHEEKKFSVDGAYNTRYEIIKKRIDKAEVRPTNERLTQPGKVAVVYSHPTEADEYREYLDFLEHQGLVGKDIEDLELQDLPGVSGLRALRVEVRPES
ncbi:MAG: GAF domain-containing protein [Vulcanimicrobiota bacterium]